MDTPSRQSIDEVLSDARSSFQRVDPAGAAALVAAGGMLVDIRPVGLRQSDGEIPEGVIVDRNQLEWRLDPSSPHRLTVIDESTYQRPIVVVCEEGFASSLAAASLRRLGLDGVTDLVGGFQAWVAARGPVRASGQASSTAPTITDEVYQGPTKD